MLWILIKTRAIKIWRERVFIAELVVPLMMIIVGIAVSLSVLSLQPTSGPTSFPLTAGLSSSTDLKLAYSFPESNTSYWENVLVPAIQAYQNTRFANRIEDMQGFQNLLKEDQDIDGGLFFNDSLQGTETEETLDFSYYILLNSRKPKTYAALLANIFNQATQVKLINDTIR